MNREEAKKMLPIIQAFAEGKRVLYCGKEWDTYAFGSDPSNYTILPDPVEQMMDIYRKSAYGTCSPRGMQVVYNAIKDGTIKI